MLYVVDIETAPQPDGTMRAWLVDACSVDNLGHTLFVSIVDFMMWLERTAPEAIYFHNLKHDGPYIMCELHRLGYTYADTRDANGHRNQLGPRQYSMLVTDRNVWFMGAICWPDGTITEIRDSLKKIPLAVAKIPAAYGLPIEKTGLDVEKERIGYYIPTADEVLRVQNDTEIVARALQIDFANGMTQLTAPADAMAEYKKTVPFHKLFAPRFLKTHPNIDAFCREAYWGGLSWVNPHIMEQELRHGLVYDYNSMYPSVMLKYPYPCGLPVRFYGTPPDGYDLYIARVRVRGFLQRYDNRPPCIRNIHTRQWADIVEGELSMTSVDIENACECYAGEIEVLDGYAWRPVKGVFDDFLDHWGQIKRTTTNDGKRTIAKRMQNSLYGKFGMNPNRRHKTPKWVGDILKWEICHTVDMGDPVNVAVSAFITAYARKELIEGIKHCTNFAYCDTDSLHLYSVPGAAARFTGRIHKSDYGAWKLEYRWVRAKFLRQKTYIEESPDGKLHIAACGCPDSCHKYITYDNFRMGASYKGKLRTKMCKGGPQLVPCRFTVREPLRGF